ncbi:MAG TPA: cation diffusion facilitator family transporter [Caulobacteraceae bacterium]|nr:cation diffusion facilitator family transporter [Caulobacteraceae bacterium]
MPHDAASPDAAAQPGSTKVDQAAALTARITRLSVACASALIVLKTVAWALSGSIAMLASLADSGLDLIAALVTFFAVRYAAVPPDSDHRYGHGKAEALASLVQSGLVFASAIAIGWEAVQHMLRPSPLSHQGLAVAIMAASLVLTGALVWAQTRVLRQAASVAVAADRTHYVADIASNLAALAGIAAAALLHAAWIDALAGFVVAAWLFFGAAGVLRSAADQLLDREAPPETREMIVKLAAQELGVLNVHELRTRVSGPYLHIQMHLELPPSMTLERAHQILIATERRLLDVYPAADILIHADPHGRAEPHGGAFAEHDEITEHAEETSG